MSTCSVLGCESKVECRNLCSKHYQRYRAAGGVVVKRSVDWGTREQHPLYGTWTWMRRRANAPIEKEWSDFWAFVRDVGVRPSEEHRLFRLDGDKPYGPNNFFWRETQISVVGENEADYRAKWLREFRSIQPEKIKDYDLRRSYGIGWVEYAAMAEKQLGVCAICKQPETEVQRSKLYDGSHRTKTRMLAVDHCHETQKIRGLLCGKCNKAIGCFRHDPERLRAAVEYLKKHASE